MSRGFITTGVIIAVGVLMLAAVGGGWYVGQEREQLGAFGDPFLSRQLATTSLTSGYILQTDGNNNTWVANSGGASSTIITFNDGSQENAGVPTLDFNTSFFSVTESPADEFNISALTDGSVTEAKLNLNAPTNNYLLVASSSATGGFEWIATSSSLLNLATGGTETNSLETTITGIADTELVIGNGADSAVYAAVSGDATLANTGALTIASDAIEEAMLKAVDAAVDEDILTYESTTGDFEWHTVDQMIATISEGALPNDNILEADLKAVDAASDEECLTYESTTGDFEWQACGSGGSSVWATTTDNNPQAGETVVYTNDDVLIGGTGSSTAEFNFDVEAASFTIATSVSATGTISGVSNSAIRFDDNAGEGIEFDFGTAADIIVRGLGSVVDWIWETGTNIKLGAVQWNSGDNIDGAAIAANTVPESAAQINAPTDEYLLIASSTATGGWEWVASTTLNLAGAAFGGFTDLDTDYANETITSTFIFADNDSGALAQPDAQFGTGDYGGLQLGNGIEMYDSSRESGTLLDLQDAFVIRNFNTLDAANDPGIEFAFLEGVSNDIRFVIPESAAGNATAMIRSVTIAGPDPDPQTNDIVTCAYWSAYDSNIDCDTGSTGPDLFVLDDIENEGDIYTSGSIFGDADDASQHQLAFTSATGDRVFTFPDDQIADLDLLIGTGAGTFGYAAMSGDATLSNSGVLTVGANVIDDTHIDWGTGANQVSIADLAGDQIAGALAFNFSGASSLELINGAAPTVDAIGEIAFDTTDNQLLIATSTTAGAPAVFPTIQKLWSASVASTSIEFVSGGVIPLPPHRDGFVIKEIHCYVDGATSVVINHSYGSGANDTETVTCDVDGASDTNIGVNNTVTSSATSTLEIGTITGSPDYVSFSIWGVWTRE